MLCRYFGHAGGEQYISGSRIRKVQSRCSVFLFGCSSGRLRSANEYDPWGTAIDYLMSGSVCVVGNLWDVTDKDIDKLTVSALTSFGLFPDQETAGDELKQQQQSRRSVNICESLINARDRCKLPYLTGASPVVYGVPHHMPNL